MTCKLGLCVRTVINTQRLVRLSRKQTSKCLGFCKTMPAIPFFSTHAVCSLLRSPFSASMRECYLQERVSPLYGNSYKAKKAWRRHLLPLKSILYSCCHVLATASHTTVLKSWLQHAHKLDHRHKHALRTWLTNKCKAQAARFVAPACCCSSTSRRSRLGGAIQQCRRATFTMHVAWRSRAKWCRPVGETNTMAVGWSTGTTHFTGYTHCMEGRPLKWTVACGEPQAREEDVAAMRTALDKARRRGGGASRPIGGGVERKATLRYLVVQGL